MNFYRFGMSAYVIYYIYHIFYLFKLNPKINHYNQLKKMGNICGSPAKKNKLYENPIENTIFKRRFQSGEMTTAEYNEH